MPYLLNKLLFYGVTQYCNALLLKVTFHNTVGEWSQTQFLEGHSSAEFSSNQLQITCLEVSSDPEDLDYLDQVCLIRVGAKLCRAVALQELSLKPML